MTKYSNGYVPDSALITLDTGDGKHRATRPSAARWYALRAKVKAEKGVTLVITPGYNAYRPYVEQEAGRKAACAQGNCLAAAQPGYSSHGGSWSRPHVGWVDAMAFDIQNYWAVPWDYFVAACKSVGLHAGLITKAIAGIDEPWHVIDLDPFGPVPSWAEKYLRTGSTAGLGSEDIMNATQEKKLDELIELQKKNLQVSGEARAASRWAPPRLGGSTLSGPSITGLLELILSKLDVTAEDIAELVAREAEPISDEQITALADSLRAELGAELVDVLAKRLAG